MYICTYMYIYTHTCIYIYNIYYILYIMHIYICSRSRARLRSLSFYSSGVSICTFVLVKQVNLTPPAPPHPHTRLPMSPSLLARESAGKKNGGFDQCLFSTHATHATHAIKSSSSRICSKNSKWAYLGHTCNATHATHATHAGAHMQHMQHMQHMHWGTHATRYS